MIHLHAEKIFSLNDGWLFGFTFWLEKTPEIPPHGHFTEAEATVVKLSAGLMLAFTSQFDAPNTVFAEAFRIKLDDTFC